MHKTSGYVRTVVAIHNLRDKAKEAVDSLQDRSISERIHDGWNTTRTTVAAKTRNFFTHPESVPCDHIPEKYSYIFRPKSRWELFLLSGTVCGIEFCYAAETAFVTPILLSLGLSIKFVTMIWCLSPLIGFFLTPVLGSMSDSCESKYGRRRPFICLYSIGIIMGLILVPNGHQIGIALGDKSNRLANESSVVTEMMPLSQSQLLFSDNFKYVRNFSHQKGNTLQTASNISTQASTINSIVDENNNSLNKSQKELSTYFYPLQVERQKRFVIGALESNTRYTSVKNASVAHLQPWSIAFTVVGTVLLDFCSDACQSPSRTYLLDVTIPEDHTAGLSTFTMMAGLGGSVGYLMGAVHWESTAWGRFFGGQVNSVFFIVTVIFTICLISTVHGFPEIPLPLLREEKLYQEYQEKLKLERRVEDGKEVIELENKRTNYGTAAENTQCDGNALEENYSNEIDVETKENNPTDFYATDEMHPNETTIHPPIAASDEHPTLKEYLKSIIHMPNSLKILCLTNLFCWMSLVCYSLYFTDFVGECVYGGDPQAPEDSKIHQLYKDGVQFGCYGMALYSLSCSVYSLFIETLVARFGAKRVYVGGQLVYSFGMVLMAICRHPAAVILLSPTAGVMYSTLFTMPYLLIAHYHCARKFRDDTQGSDCGVRGIGTDVAAVSSMVFLSQFILSLSMGSIVESVGSNVATVCAAALLSMCGAVCATQVMYLDM